MKYTLETRKRREGPATTRERVSQYLTHMKNAVTAYPPEGNLRPVPASVRAATGGIGVSRAATGGRPYC